MIIIDVSHMLHCTVRTSSRLDMTTLFAAHAARKAFAGCEGGVLALGVPVPKMRDMETSIETNVEEKYT